MKKLAFTSITTNYLPKARVLAHSVKRHASDVSFQLVVAEPFDHSLLRPDDPFDCILSIDQLGIPDLQRWLFPHAVVEACTALKGLSLEKLLDTPDDAAVLYFDPDIVVTHSLDGLFDEFDAASIVLTPHGTEPETEPRAIIDNEISHMRYGVYNLGFIGVRNTKAGRKFARWWTQRLHEYCYDDIESGIFTDQRWIDLAPAFFEGVKVLRNPGYNVATWNLSHRVVTGSINNGLRVDEQPLVFYHFSGFDSGAMETMLAAYGGKSPVLQRFRKWYVRECEKMGQRDLGSRPWLYSRFDNGEAITKEHRRTYRHRKDLQMAFKDPFSARNPDTSFLHWYIRHGSDNSSQVVSHHCDCQILVLALDKLVDAETSLRDLIARTANKASLKVVGTADTCDRLSLAVPGLQFIELSAASASAEGREAWMLKQIAECKYSSLLFVQLGLRVPELWDARLLWGAKRERSVVTVSPLYDGVPLTALITSETEAEDFGSDTVDRLVFDLDNRQPLEAPNFLYECFYVDTSLAQATPSCCSQGEGSDGRQPDLSTFARSCSMAGYSHVILNDLYVGLNPRTGHRPLVARRRCSAVELYEHRNTLSEVRSRYPEIVKTHGLELPTVSQRVSRRHLHISHAWGGGLNHWIRSYCSSDTEHINMQLRPVGGPGAYGSDLELYADIDSPSPIARWVLPLPIKATVPASISYKRIIESIIEDYGIDAVFVSSLIGHSMDVLNTGIPTLFICHDFFPLTPEIYIRSRHLSGNRVSNFSVDEVFDRGPVALFPNLTRAEAKTASRAFREIVNRRQIRLVAPSPSTRQIYLDLVPGLHPADIAVIPHGTVSSLLNGLRPGYDPRGRLRVIVPGRVAPEKGSTLLARVLPLITEFADVLLVGCGLDGQYLGDIPGVQVISRYEPEDLASIMAEFQPHVGMLLSDFPETFSYTLDELLVMGIPPVAVRIGGLADRIRESENGFLVENDSDSVVDMLKALDRNRDRLKRVRAVLEASRPRTESDMIREYEALLDLPRFSHRALNSRKSLPAPAYRYVSPFLDVQDDSSVLAGNHVDREDGRMVVSRHERSVRKAARPLRHMGPQQYGRLISRIRQAVDARVPPGAIVAVVSKGDEQLLRLRGRRAWHFPQVHGGIYAGHHPANSAEAIAHIEVLRSRGAEFLVFPSTAFWWFDHYREFRQHLEKNYKHLLREDDTCVIYALSASAESSSVQSAQPGKHSRASIGTSR
jgi:glycosyltransferase involved in cell wall biosynthesis